MLGEVLAIEFPGTKLYIASLVIRSTLQLGPFCASNRIFILAPGPG